MRCSVRWLAALVVVGLAASPVAQAQPAPDGMSWGKPAVSFLQYRTDAVECAWLASSTAPVSSPTVDQVFALDGVQDVYGAIEQTKRNQYRLWHNVVDQLEPALETCLRSRGYRPFKLTAVQGAQLKQLKRGSVSRHRYLYGLAIDPEVLKVQGL